MDFNQAYSKDQQAFRVAVRSWLSHNVPTGLRIPPDGRPLDQHTQQTVKDFRRKLGAQGWLAPSWPLQYGGGAMSPAFEAIIMEEIQRIDLPSMGDNNRWIPAMMVWGTEEQKRRYVTPALRGETITWQAFNEPHSGSDLAGVRTSAVLEGDRYVINGEKAYITGRFDPDYLWTLAVTDQLRPRRLNLGVFMVDARTPGIRIETQRLLMGSERRVYLEDVIIPADCLVGLPYQGWEIAQTILEGERGGYTLRGNDDETAESIQQFLREERERLEE